MLNYGVSPRTGNVYRRLHCVCRQPLLYRWEVTAGDRIYRANYLEKRIVSKFDPISKRKYKQLVVERRQYEIPYDYSNL